MLVDGAIIGTAKAAVEEVDFVVKRPSLVWSFPVETMWCQKYSSEFERSTGIRLGRLSLRQ
jgi:hypothetical protein